MANPDKLWVRVIRAKYNCGPFSLPKVSPRSNCSNLWRTLTSNWPEVEDNIYWSVSNGINTWFWKDRWIPKMPCLADMCLGNMPRGQEDFPISFYAQNGVWNWNLFESFVPNHLLDKIAGINPSSNSNINDFPCWKWSLDGCFSIKFPYQFISKSPDSDAFELAPIFKKFWLWKGPNRIKSFLWKLAHGILLTNVERNRRGLTADVICPGCNSCPETIMHILRDYEETQQFWDKVIKPDHRSKFFSLVYFFGWNGTFQLLLLE